VLFKPVEFDALHYVLRQSMNKANAQDGGNGDRSLRTRKEVKEVKE